MYLLDAEKSIQLNENIFDVCDAHSPDLCWHVETFYDLDSGTLNEDLNVSKKTQNALIINYLLIPEQFRGLGLGKLVINSISKNFSPRCGVIILQAVPQQIYRDDDLLNEPRAAFHYRKEFVDSMKYDSLEKNEKKAHQKLRNKLKLGLVDSISAETGYFADIVWQNKKNQTEPDFDTEKTSEEVFKTLLKTSEDFEKHPEKIQLMRTTAMQIDNTWDSRTNNEFKQMMHDKLRIFLPDKMNSSAKMCKALF